MASEQADNVWTRMGPKSGIKRVLPQTGERKSILRDASRGARVPGKRVSRTGKEYWETRKNRSDQLGTKL